MRDVSFHETQEEYRSGMKTLTRRVKWHVKPGEHFRGVNQMQGIPKGGHRLSLGESICYLVEIEPVDEIIRRPIRPDRFGVMRSEAVREGFPAFFGHEDRFVDLLIKINRASKLKRDDPIFRVDFARVL